VSDLRAEIESAVNRCSAEGGSGTPDFVLAEFLVASLAAFDAAVRRRDEWWSFTPLVGGTVPAVSGGGLPRTSPPLDAVVVGAAELLWCEADAPVGEGEVSERCQLPAGHDNGHSSTSYFWSSSIGGSHDHTAEVEP
jgi:hypothetical protein